MKAFLLRMLYGVIVFLVLMYLLPLFFSVVGFTLAANAWALVRAILVCLVVLYVLFGPAPPSPF